MIDEKKLIEWAELVRDDYKRCPDDCYEADVVQYIIDGIIKQPRVGEWIPCSERLPDELVPVNVTWVNRRPVSYYEDIKDKPFTATAVYYKGKWYWWDAVVEDRIAEHGDLGAKPIDIWIDVIAWMPLPEPYKEGE